MALTDENNITNQAQNIVDINLDGVTKQKFRINGDNNSIIELNLSDLGIVDRLEVGYKKLQDFVKDAAKVDVDSDNLSDDIKAIDKQMRDTIDYIFDSNVSEVCCKYGTMLDPKNGMYKFEVILDGLTKLYTDNLNSEYKKMKARIDATAKQYIPQDHKPKSKSVKRKEQIQKDE